MSKQPEDIIIKDFHKGIAASPHVGFQTIHNLDTYTKPGIIRCNRATQKVSSTTVTDLIKWIVKNPTGIYYALGGTGKVYKSDTGAGTWSVISGNTTTNASGNGLAIWKNYLFVARDAKIDVMKLSDETWTNDWQSIPAVAQDGDWHPMLHGQDDILYIGGNNQIMSLQQVAEQTFAPGTGSTFTWNSAALDLPSGTRVKCLAELGRNLMIGVIAGSDTFGGFIKADIYPWDRNSDSFELPVSLPEVGVHQMIAVSNLLYVIAGIRGGIYVTNGSSWKKINALPYELLTPTDTDSTTCLDFYPGAISFYSGRIYFGVSNNTGSLANAIEEIGVWSLDLDGRLFYEHSISTGTTTSAASGNALIVSAILGISIAGQLLIGWQDNTIYGIDITEDEFYASYGGIVISPFFSVGTSLKKRTFQQLEISLVKPLVTSQAIRVSYRKDLSASFTQIVDATFATYGAVTSVNVPALIVDAEYVQIKIELDGTTTSTPELKEVRLR